MIPPKEPGFPPLFRVLPWTGMKSVKLQASLAPHRKTRQKSSREGLPVGSPHFPSRFLKSVSLVKFKQRVADHCEVFTQQMNQTVFAFRRYEDASVSHTGIDSHLGLSHVGLYDTRGA